MRGRHHGPRTRSPPCSLSHGQGLTSTASRAAVAASARGTAARPSARRQPARRARGGVRRPCFHECVRRAHTGSARPRCGPSVTRAARAHRARAQCATSVVVNSVAARAREFAASERADARARLARRRAPRRRWRHRRARRPRRAPRRGCKATARARATRRPAPRRVVVALARLAPPPAGRALLCVHARARMHRSEVPSTGGRPAPSAARGAGQKAQPVERASWLVRVAELARGATTRWCLVSSSSIPASSPFVVALARATTHARCGRGGDALWHCERGNTRVSSWAVVRVLGRTGAAVARLELETHEHVRPRKLPRPRLRSLAARAVDVEPRDGVPACSPLASASWPAATR